VPTIWEATDNPEDEFFTIQMTLYFENDNTMSEIFQIPRDYATLEEVFYLVMGEDALPFEESMKIGYWTVNGMKVDGSYPLSDGDEVCFYQTESMGGGEPADGVTLTIHVTQYLPDGTKMSKTFTVVSPSAYFVDVCPNLCGESFEFTQEWGYWVLDGEIVTPKTLIYDGCHLELHITQSSEGGEGGGSSSDGSDNDYGDDSGSITPPTGDASYGEVTMREWMKTFLSKNLTVEQYIDAQGATMIQGYDGDKIRFVMIYDGMGNEMILVKEYDADGSVSYWYYAYDPEKGDFIKEQDTDEMPLYEQLIMELDVAFHCFAKLYDSFTYTEEGCYRADSLSINGYEYTDVSVWFRGGQLEKMIYWVDSVQIVISDVNNTHVKVPGASEGESDSVGGGSSDNGASGDGTQDDAEGPHWSPWV
jgi:hypothetical protein